MLLRLMTAAILVGLIVAAPAPAVAGESYYVLIFGAQSSVTKIKNKHTWATFVRAVGEGTDPAGYQLFTHTISLAPATMEVRTFALKPEPATNMDLEGSLDYARSKGADTTVWGPLRMRPEGYRRSLEIFNLIQSGAVEYRAIDTLRTTLVADCIHAVTAVDPQFGRGHYPLVRTGKSASRYIARQLLTRNELNLDAPDQPWILAPLGLPRPGVTVVLPSEMARRPVPFALGVE